MKKFGKVAVTAMALALLAGCGSGNGKGDKDGGTQATDSDGNKNIQPLWRYLVLKFPMILV